MLVPVRFATRLLTRLLLLLLLLITEIHAIILPIKVDSFIIHL
jgi:hypothetical protein